MKTQPARPPSGRIAHPFSPTVNQINDGKWYCLPFWNRVKLNRRDRPAGGSPTSFRV
ncbi:MAG: hypothetical protein LBL62_03540 [Planctomycetaceae bacterium]|nr:hypothetical protein [Planctomycetaceae bacterium]